MFLSPRLQLNEALFFNWYPWKHHIIYTFLWTHSSNATVAIQAKK